MRKLRDHALGWVFGVLFLLCLVGQAFSGLADYNEQQQTHALPPVSLVRYLTSSSFAVDVAENWQSEYLQFLLYIVLTVWLIQKGSPGSKSPEEVGTESDKDQK